jgi:hypothetical protein
LKWENWETIEAWIDWISNFETNSDLKKYSPKDLNSASDEELTKKLEKEKLEKEKLEKEKLEKENSSNNWKEISNKELSNRTSNVAKSVEKLPETWPTTTFLIIFTFILSSWIYFSRRKKA